MKPVTVMMTGPITVAAAIAMIRVWYVPMPRRFTHQNTQIAPRAIGTLTPPRSSSAAASPAPATRSVSRSMGAIRYATTPMPIERPNHWAKLAMNPRNGSSARVA